MIKKSDCIGLLVQNYGFSQYLISYKYFKAIILIVHWLSTILSNALLIFWTTSMIIFSISGLFIFQEIPKCKLITPPKNASTTCPTHAPKIQPSTQKNMTQKHHHQKSKTRRLHKKQPSTRNSDKKTQNHRIIQETQVLDLVGHWIHVSIRIRNWDLDA